MALSGVLRLKLAKRQAARNKKKGTVKKANKK